MIQPVLWKTCLETAAISDVGLRRANNQDSYVVFLAGNETDFARRGHLFMVADGMGAHAAGELASKIAVDTVPLAYYKSSDKTSPEALLTAVVEANNQILSRADASPEFKGMGTTATVLAILPEGALVAHVGDSRAYRVRGNQIHQLTFDHSLVWELRATGQKFEEQFSNLIGKNIITRSLGPNPTVNVDLEGPHPCEPGDSFLLCSDGLTGQVQDAEIGAILRCLPLDEAAQTLVNLANLRGGPDNITVVTARVKKTEPDEGDAQKPSAGSVGNRRIKLIDVLLWLIPVFALSGAMGLWSMEQPLPAGAALLAAIAAGVVAVYRLSGKASKPILYDGRRFGRGPFVCCDCTPNTEFINKLLEILGQLRDAAEHENWVIDWSAFNKFNSSAESALNSSDLTVCARQYLRAINFIMAELKKQSHPGSVKR